MPIRLAIADRTVILVDDGAATGATMLAAVRAARKQGAKHVIVALPVASEEAMRALGNEADEVHCLLTPPGFRAVGEWYEHFEQVDFGGEAGPPEGVLRHHIELAAA